MYKVAVMLQVIIYRNLREGARSNLLIFISEKNKKQLYNIEIHRFHLLGNCRHFILPALSLLSQL